MNISLKKKEREVLLLALEELNGKMEFALDSFYEHCNDDGYNFNSNEEIVNIIIEAEKKLKRE